MYICVRTRAISLSLWATKGRQRGHAELARIAFEISSARSLVRALQLIAPVALLPARARAATLCPPIKLMNARAIFPNRRFCRHLFVPFYLSTSLPLVQREFYVPPVQCDAFVSLSLPALTATRPLCFCVSIRELWATGNPYYYSLGKKRE